MGFEKVVLREFWRLRASTAIGGDSSSLAAAMAVSRMRAFVEALGLPGLGELRWTLARSDDHLYELMRHDVTFPLSMEVGEIYNLACPASPVYDQFDPVQTTKTSVRGADSGADWPLRPHIKLHIGRISAAHQALIGYPDRHENRSPDLSVSAQWPRGLPGAHRRPAARRRLQGLLADHQEPRAPP